MGGLLAAFCVLLAFANFDDQAVYGRDGQITACWGSDRHGWGNIILGFSTIASFIALSGAALFAARWRWRIGALGTALAVAGFTGLSMRARAVDAERCNLQKSGLTP